MMKSTNKRSATSVDRRVGSCLKHLRICNDITQDDLAKLVDVSYQQIQKYENGSNRISVSRLWEFCEIFDVKPNFFFLGLSKGFKLPDVEDDAVSSLELFRFGTSETKREASMS